MSDAMILDPSVQYLGIGGAGNTQLVESLIELEVSTNPLEIDVEIPEPLISAKILDEFSVTVDVDTDFLVTVDQFEENVILEVVEFPVVIEECGT